MAHSPFDHVKDAPYFETSPTIGLVGEWKTYVDAHGHEHPAFGLHLPEIAWLPSPAKMIAKWTGGKIDGHTVESIMGFQITKFMVLQTLALLIVLFLMWGLSRKVRNGDPVRGRFWNFWEAIVVFLRNEVVRPTIGDGHHGHDEHGHDGPEHDADGSWQGLDPAHQGGAYLAYERQSSDDPAQAAQDRLAAHESGPITDVMAAPHPHGGPHPADKYLPFVATLFLYILTCNLLGMIPWLGSPTGDISVTAALAVITLCATVASGVAVMGGVGFLKNLVPGMDLPGPIAVVLIPMIWLIEALGLLIKHFVLAVRLFANMMAGHVVLAVFLSFIATFALGESGMAPSTENALFYLVAPASILGQVGVSLLELFVAFLQSYIFAFLATLFIASVIHEH